MSRPRSAAVQAAVAIAALAAAIGLIGHFAGGFPRLEEDTVSARFKLRPAQSTHGIVVVAIDEASFEELNQRWPFPRSLHAKVVDQLAGAEAREIVYDVQFTEPSEDDLELYEAIERAGGVVLATGEVDPRVGSNVLGGDENLERVGAEAGAGNLSDGERGVLNRFPYAVSGLRSIAVVTAERLTGRRVDPSRFRDDGALIDWRGGARTFPTLSFADVIEGRFDRELVRDAIVVVGSSAATLQDIHATPTTGTELMSGPEVQANAIATTLDGLPLRHAPGWLAALVVVLMAAAAPLAQLRLRPAHVAMGALALAVVYAMASYGAFAAELVLPVVWPLLTLALGTIATIARTNVVETRERIRVAEDNARLEARVAERTAELRETQLEVVHRLARAAELRDEETGRHVMRLGLLTHRLALATGMPAKEAEILGEAAVLHDVGKIGIPDGVLHKPGAFSSQERALMRTHTEIGAAILDGSSSPLVTKAREIALTHHERWDGSGYPNGLKGLEIPLAGRICAICDVFDALLSERPYKPAWPLAHVLDELRGQRGLHFDPELVDLFLELAPALHAELHGNDGGAAPRPALIGGETR